MANPEYGPPSPTAGSGPAGAPGGTRASARKLELRDAPRALIALLVFLVCLPILIVATPYFVVVAFRRRLERRRLTREIGERWQGRRLLLVYSNSPVWQEYIETGWLPRFADVAVALNWSERKRWPSEHPFEARVFRAWAGRREFNPVAIAFLPDGTVEVVRFWLAFRDFKHGRPARLRAAEQRLEEVAAAVRGAGRPGEDGGA